MTRRLLIRAALPVVLAVVAVADLIAELVIEYRRALTFPNVTDMEDR